MGVRQFPGRLCLLILGLLQQLPVMSFRATRGSEESQPRRRPSRSPGEDSSSLLSSLLRMTWQQSVTIVLTCAFLLARMTISTAGPSFAPFNPYVRPATSMAPDPVTSRDYTPAEIRHAYGIDRLKADGHGQVIGIVSAYVGSGIASDLNTFNQKYNLPPINGLPGRPVCTVQNGPHPCFQRVDLGQSTPTDDNWTTEADTGTQWTHAIAPGADILLIVSAHAQLDQMIDAADVAVKSNATVVAMSWGAPEYPGETEIDAHFRHPGVSFVASAGDDGTGVTYPAASPYVIAVGGTSLQIDPRGNVQSEVAWTNSGGGISSFEPLPVYQQRVGVGETNGHRAVPDVAYSADPNLAFPIFNAQAMASDHGWVHVGGTSAGVPQWAAILALADQLRERHPLSITSLDHAPLYDAATPARYALDFRDVTSGGNGNCPSCAAHPGYDLVTGLGTPHADQLVPYLATLPA